MKARTQTKSAGATATRKDGETKHIDLPFQIKADSVDEEARTFTGMASTWDMDLGGDVIHKGAFKRTLNNWKRSKRPLPLLDSHQAWGTIRSVVGKVEDARETDEGLEATFSVIDGPDGDEIWRRIKGGYVDGLSIGYRAIKIETPTEEEQRAGVWRHLKEVELREISVVLYPMNTDARIDGRSVKALAAQIAAIEEAAECRDLTDEEKAELAELQTKIGALLDSEAQPGPGTPPTAAPPAPEPEPKIEGLAPEDPKRLELDARIRELRLQRLATRASA